MVKNPLHHTAQVYAKSGIPVFPVQPNGKRPLVPDWENAASVDPAQIEAWWTQWPDANIGIPVGRAGLYVIDLDVKNGAPGCANWNEEFEWQCPATYTTGTPSGGRHIYFKNPGGLRNTAGKLASGIDTRGEGGYVLAPPSVVDGRPYTVEDDSPIAELPDFLIEALAHTQASRKESKTDELDTPWNISRAIDYLQNRAPLAIEGEGGDTTTYTVAACVRDYGISEDECCVLMSANWNPRCEPPWEHDELEEKIAHAYRYPQNEIGSRAEIDRTQRDIELQAQFEQRASTQEKPERTWMWPDEGEGLPELTYWDEDKTLPNQPGGASVVLYGEFSAHKTNVVLTKVLDAALDAGARVVFAAGEGFHGVLTKRIPAHCRARGVTTKALRDKMRVDRDLPRFADGSHVREFIARHEDFKPHIVVLDTLATALAGVDENSSEAAQYLTANAPVGWIKAASDATVILTAHAGKDRSRGIRGNSGFGGNADVILAAEADKDRGLVKLTVEKMRDGEDGHSLYFAVGEGVPVPKRITKDEYEERGGGERKAPKGDKKDPLELSVKLKLSSQNFRTEGAGLSHRQLASLLLDEPDAKPHSVASNKLTKALDSAVRQNRAWVAGYGSEVSVGTRNEWRWWLRPVEATE